MAVRVLYLVVAALLAVTVSASVIKRATQTPSRAGTARITEGYQAGVGQFPHQALVVGDSQEVFGGSLITTTAVLTAAFCIDNSKTWTIRLGGIHRSEDEATAFIVQSSWGVKHPDYDSNGHYSNNVGLVFLPQEAPLNNFINLVALPSTSEVDESFVGQSALISGWGYTDDGTCCPELLLWTEVTVVPNSACAALYEPDVVIDSTLCAGNNHGGSCNSDHGGALVLETGSGYKQIGVASFNFHNDCGIAGVPGGFTRVTSVLDWITAAANMDAR